MVIKKEEIKMAGNTIVVTFNNITQELLMSKTIDFLYDSSKLDGDQNATSN